MAMAMALPAVAAVPVLHPGPCASSRPQYAVRWQRRDFPGVGCSEGGERRYAVAFRSRPWRGACRALKPNSDEVATPPPAFVADQPQVPVALSGSGLCFILYSTHGWPCGIMDNVSQLTLD
jgi:hypothetical protein